MSLFAIRKCSRRSRQEWIVRIHRAPKAFSIYVVAVDEVTNLARPTSMEAQRPLNEETGSDRRVSFREVTYRDILNKFISQNYATTCKR